jgi:hypothetical protein
MPVQIARAPAPKPADQAIDFATWLEAQERKRRGGFKMSIFAADRQSKGEHENGNG